MSLAELLCRSADVQLQLVFVTVAMDSLTAPGRKALWAPCLCCSGLAPRCHTCGSPVSSEAGPSQLVLPGILSIGAVTSKGGESFAL